MKTELKYCPFCHASGGDIIDFGSGEHRQVECTVCSATHNYDMWQGRPAAALDRIEAQTDDAREKALADFNTAMFAVIRPDERVALISSHIETIRAALRSATAPKNVEAK